MNRANREVVAALRAGIDQCLAARPGELHVIGICGAQGSGKSTLASAVAQGFEREGVPCAVLSLDDLYLSSDERAHLARTVHPLLRTRGVPGTHDVALGLEIIAALRAEQSIALPRFDKSSDERAPQSEWPRAPGGCRVLLFEGWCVGARPQSEDELHKPVNDLEAREDAGAVWRRYANDALAGPYQALFAQVDYLALLQAPGFDVVLDWRNEQERDRRKARDDAVARGMSREEVRRFVAHYERITRHIIDEMPGRADLVFTLDRRRTPLRIVEKSSRGKQPQD